MKALESFSAGSSSVEGGSEAVCAGVQRINARAVEIIGTLLKFAVQWGPPRDIDERTFLLARCGGCR